MSPESDPVGLPDDGDLGDPFLGPGVHPPALGTYSYVVPSGVVHATPHMGSDMFAGGSRTRDDPMVAAVLRPAFDNCEIDDEDKALLPWALTTVTAHAHSGLGLVAAASYAGPGATGLIGNLAHKTRGSSYAAELVTAACLLYRAWPSADGTLVGDGIEAEARLDFGIKLLGHGIPRRTIEADVLLSFSDGTRAAVDVKHSRAGVYRTPPGKLMLAVIDQAIDRQEISSFHFVTRGRFRPAVSAAVAGHDGIHVHEHVWPDDADRRSIASQERQALDYRAVIRRANDGVAVIRGLQHDLADAAAAAYRRGSTHASEIVEITTDSEFTYLMDIAAIKNKAAPPERLLAGFGVSHAGASDRDRAFMRGFPLPGSPTPVDRGHLIARQAGGDEGIGLNLIPQERRLNQGRGPHGRRWRRLEQLAAAHPGSHMFVRALHDNDTGVPVRLEYLLILPDGTTHLERFRNRPGAP